LDVVQISCNNI